MVSYRRPAFGPLNRRLSEAPLRIQILAGPRQVGKTTLIRQIIESRPRGSSLYVAAEVSASSPTSIGAWDDEDEVMASAPRTVRWLVELWARAVRAAMAWAGDLQSNEAGLPFLLVIDEIQKVSDWSDAIKGLWDEARAASLPLQLVLLGSSPLLMHKGLSESLAGRFEMTRLTHWSFEEMNAAFSVTLEQYVYFGGFPGSASYFADEQRWRSYVDEGLVRPNIDQDILMMTRVDKPALLSQLFELACHYSGQIVALDKLMGQLRDAGNVTTLARYLELLADAGLLGGLQKYSEGAVRRRNAPPKLQAFNNALVSVQGTHGYSEAVADRSHWGRLVESAVGAHLVNSAEPDTVIRYWRDGHHEVDFVIERRGRLAAIEVKIRPRTARPSGLEEFKRRFPDAKTWQVGGDQWPLGEVLKRPAHRWLE